jgi:hypothetical protein
MRIVDVAGHTRLLEALALLDLARASGGPFGPDLTPAHAATRPVDRDAR